MNLAVTTSLHPSPAEAHAAREAAARHLLPFAPRARLPLPEVAAKAGAQGLLVLTARHALLWLEGH